MRRPPLSEQARRRDAIAGVVIYLFTLALGLVASLAAMTRGLGNPRDVGLLKLSIAIPLIASFLVIVWVPALLWLRRTAERPKLAFTAFTGLAVVSAAAFAGGLIAAQAGV